MLDGSQELGRVGIVGDVGEEARDFQLRLQAVMHLPIEFQHDALVDDHRDVALLGSDRAHLRVLTELAPVRAGGEFDTAVPATRATVVADAGDEIENEVLVAGGVEQRADPGARAQFGEREGEHRAAGPDMLAAPLRRERQEVALSFAAGQRARRKTASGIGARVSPRRW